MKKLILTFFLIVLIVLLIKRKEQFFVQGCKISNLKKPTENDFYQCLLDDINNYNKKLRSNPTNSQVKIVKNLGNRLKNYFISLYIHGLEKDFRFIIAFVPSSYRRGTNAVEVLTQNIRMKDFMVGGYDKGRYGLKPHSTGLEKVNFAKKVDYMGKKVAQIHGIFVGMGFKIAFSNRANNFDGKKCSNMEYRPYRTRGYCIPGNFSNFDRYLKGGIYYDYRMITKISRNPYYGGGAKYYEKEPSKYLFKIRQTGHNGIGCGARPEQTDFQFQRGLDSCMSGCYMRSRKGCHTAYGDSKIKEIYVVPDVDFFNLFYMTNRKSEFLQNNTSALNKFHK